MKDKLLFNGRFGQVVNPRTHRVEQGYSLHRYQTLYLARNRDNEHELIAMRLRTGRSGVSQWLSELKVYLLPNFGHENVLPFLGCDKRVRKSSQIKTSMPRTGRVGSEDNNDDVIEECREGTTDSAKNGSEGNGELFFDTDDLLERFPVVLEEWPSSGSEEFDFNSQYKRSDTMFEYNVDDLDEASPKQTKSPTQSSGSPTKMRSFTKEDPLDVPIDLPVKIDYWILNDFSHCITLRHYLMMHTISWPELLKIASGIMQGVAYLHENLDYQDWNRVKIVDKFIRSTRGALKKIVFKGEHSVVHMKPHLAHSIIHKNLSSLNIVLRPDMTPCIWNFGQSYICHPFQPINREIEIDWPSKDIHKTSPYSAPEVLLGQACLTLSSLKAVDSYSCGILLWEMMSRTKLPPIEGLNEIERIERQEPDAYSEPFSRDLGGTILYSVLKDAVCHMKARPVTKNGWLIGKKTSKFVQIYRDLWDHDYDARLHALTVIDRLDQLSARNTDKRSRYTPLTDRRFDPTKRGDLKSNQAPLMPCRQETNICFEDLDLSSDDNSSSFSKD